ncbi:MAG: 23S rRNA (cytidine(2498)-2'-O)-methyltransferase RlmM [Aquisalimonadaceae bacterium]
MQESTQHTDACDGLLFYCRAGSENDCAAEIMDLVSGYGVAGYCRTQPDTGHVVFQRSGGEPLARLVEKLHWLDLIFARQWLVLLKIVSHLPPDDRVTPLLASLAGYRRSYADLWLEYPDTNEGKGLSRFCKRFRGALAGALEATGISVTAAVADRRLHAFFTDSTRALLAEAPVARTTPWHSGILRLKQPGEAPSRSTLKLDEALQVLLNADERQALLEPGNTAVDLGAAPGGWTWQLVRRSIRVTAVDNGPMQDALMDSGLVEHLRVDGFRYRPPRPVDLLVCDMVEKPGRITRLMRQWLERGDCRAAIFNLKLPMKQRYRAVRECLELLPERTSTGQHLDVRCRQLYHDRDEVTVAVAPRAPSLQ